MSKFTQHTIESAPESAKATLAATEKALGFVPNLYANLAESPAALKAYTTLSSIFEQSSLTPTEQQVVLLAVSVYNGCEFCVAAHSVIAKNMLKVDPGVVDALRNRETLRDAHLEALAQFSRKVVDLRGWVSPEDTDAFFAAGFTQAQALDVIVGVGLKTLSNYTNHIAGTQVNRQFAAEAWDNGRV